MAKKLEIVQAKDIVHVYNIPPLKLAQIEKCEPGDMDCEKLRKKTDVVDKEPKQFESNG